MKAIRGDKLAPGVKATVLAAYVHRHTVEHKAPAVCRMTKPATETDAEWLAAHAFYITNKGELSRRHRHCVPACMSD